MSYTNRIFTWDFDSLKRFYERYIVKWLNSAMGWTEAQKAQARENIGVKDVTVEEVVQPFTEEVVAGYITDKTRRVIGRLMKNGAIEWAVMSSIEQSLASSINALNEVTDTISGDVANISSELEDVSKEIPDNGSKIVKYLIDNDNRIVGTIDVKGNVSFLAGGGFAGEQSESKPILFDAVKVVADKNGSIIGWVTTGGKVHVIDLEAETLTVNGEDFKPDAGMPEQIFPLLGFLANGTHMKDFVNDKAYNLLASMSKGVYTKDGLPVSVEPTIVIHDDDAIDSQIPSSFNGTVPVADKGGYASRMLPMIMSLNARYGNSINAKNHKIVVGIAAEGQRIGLTPLYGDDDTFTGEMNANGKILNKIIEHEGWEALCHSMTARYINASYIVKGLTSDFANVIKSNSYVSTNYHSYLHTTVYDTTTQKNYYLKLDRSGWNELPKQYNKPYLATYIVVDGTTIVNEDFRSEYDAGRKLIINPTYSVEYQVKTWFERAKEAGLHYIDAGVQWGSSQSTWHMREGLKYCSFFFSRHGDYNTIPIDTNAIRLNNSGGLDSSDNAYTDERYASIISKIDSCIADNGLMVFMNHSNTDYFNNYYMADTDYYTRIQPSETGRLDYYDANYPESWRIPLNGTQLTEMLNDPDCPYWTTPPLKKRNNDGTLSNTDMESWADWYPCPGTKMALIYDYLTYAIHHGVRFASSSEAIDKFGNMLNIGVKKTNGTDWQADPLLGNIPEQNGSHYVIGADGSIDCEIV